MVPRFQSLIFRSESENSPTTRVSMNEEDSFEDAGGKLTPLSTVTDAFEELSTRGDCCLREAASIAYAETCAPYHTWAVRTAVSAHMYTLPTSEQLSLRLNESDDSAEKEMQRYIDASLPIIQYINKLYTSRNISLDW